LRDQVAGAFRISLSGLALSSLGQYAITSQIAATDVTPRIVRYDAGLTSMSTPLANVNVSAVCLSTRPLRFGAVAKTPERKLNAVAACAVETARIGRTPRSRGARTWRWSTQAAT
jgi:hypothetical protein